MKKQLLIILILIILAVVSYFGFQSYQKIKAKKVSNEQISQLPKTTSFQWIGKSAVSNDKASVILFFSPDCEHCQYEARAIVAKKNEFTNINLWWVSVADSTAIMKFSKTYGLNHLSNNYLAHLSAEKVYQTFGSVSVPHIFIYNNHKVLQKEFKGETKIDAILKYTNSPN